MTGIHADQATFNAPVYFLRAATPPGESTAKENQQLAALKEKVVQFWLRDVLELLESKCTLRDQQLLWKPDAVAHPWESTIELPLSSSSSPPEEKHLLDLFHEAGRTLLILGLPESGKTVLLLQLARALIESNSSQSWAPIPVVFSLSFWSRWRPSMFDWFVRQLEERYNMPERFSRKWLESNRIIPLLDDLETVKLKHRDNCVRAINKFIAETGVQGICVCCETTAYEKVPDRLVLGGAVEVTSE